MCAKPCYCYRLIYGQDLLYKVSRDPLFFTIHISFSKMIIFTTLVIAAVLGSGAACPDPIEDAPDCSACKYNNNIGVIPIPDLCGLYWECRRNPAESGEDSDDFLYTLRCCAEGLVMNADHQGCELDYSESNNEGCQAEHGCCPEIPTTTAQYPCTYYGFDGASSYKDSEETEYLCAPGTEWKQDICTCDWGSVEAPGCAQIMSFSFEDSLDSSSCNYVIDGTPVGNASSEGGVLNLDGDGDALLIGFFNTFFAWNPLSNQFTICLWVNPNYDYGDTQGIFSTNCRDADGEKSLLDIFVEGGKLSVILGSDSAIATEVDIPAGEESKICVTFDNGTYAVFVNGAPELGPVFSGSEYPVSSNEPAILGAVEGYPDFSGYIDDVSFWTEVLSDQYIADCYDARASGGR